MYKETRQGMAECAATKIPLAAAAAAHYGLGTGMAVNNVCCCDAMPASRI